MRYTVRVDPSFFDQLDDQLPAERGPNGEPCVADFLLVDLTQIAESFAASFEQLIQPIPGRPDYRSVVASGFVVARVFVTGQLNGDEVALMSVRFDLSAR